MMFYNLIHKDNEKFCFQNMFGNNSQALKFVQMYTWTNRNLSAISRGLGPQAQKLFGLFFGFIK